MLDAENTFSENQAVTATALSTNVINIEKLGDMARGHAVPLEVKVKEDFATLTSLEVQVVESDNSDLSSADVLSTSGAIPLSKLDVGYRFPIHHMPSTSKKYVGLNYVVAGSNATAGQISAHLALDVQDPV